MSRGGIIVFDEAMDSMEDLSNGIEGMFSKIPGGGMLFKMLGGEQLTGQLQKSATAGFGAMGQAMQAGVGPLGALKAGMAAFNATVMINPILLVVAGVVALFPSYLQ